MLQYPLKAIFSWIRGGCRCYDADVILSISRNGQGQGHCPFHEVDNPTIFLPICEMEKKSRGQGIIGRLLQFSGYIDNHKILPGNIFGLILKKQDGRRGCFSAFSTELLAL